MLQRLDRLKDLVRIAGLFAMALLVAAPTWGGNLTVMDVSPNPRTLTAPVQTAISLHFDRPVERTSIVPRRSFWAFGKWSGAADGTIAFADDDHTVILQPHRPFSAGERVLVVVSNQVQATDGTFLRDGGYSFQFWTATRPATLSLTEADRVNTLSEPGEMALTEGGLASDLNGDGFLDITTLTADSNDLRVFLNRAAEDATFGDLVSNPNPISATEIEPADFNADGLVDVVFGGTRSGAFVLLGKGDGTFGDFQTLGAPVPQDIAILDADGDGDIDVATTDVVTERVYLHYNDGTGTFPQTLPFGTGAQQAIAAADMNEDGLIDLVVGQQTQEEIKVFTSDGDGTFTSQASFTAGGDLWAMMIGDINGDGSEDVSLANGNSNHGAILFGDGSGGFGPPMTYPLNSLAVGTTLGDLDGDGDLDWVTSSNKDDWAIFVNDGSGTFSLNQQIQSSQSAAISLAFDADNDGDLDLGLIDDLADEVIIMAHDGVPALFRDGFESGGTGEWTTP